MKRIFVICLMPVLLSSLFGCTREQTGIVAGGAVGAVVGGVVTGGSAVGTAVGAVGGALAGHAIAKKTK